MNDKLLICQQSRKENHRSQHSAKQDEKISTNRNFKVHKIMGLDMQNLFLFFMKISMSDAPTHRTEIS